MKLICIALIAVVLAGDWMAVNCRPRSSSRQLTDADLQAARQLAIDFTSEFVRTADLSTVIKDRFSKDFIERYTKAKSKEATSSDVYFVPGLGYSSRLLVEAGPEDWLRFYSAANNLIFFGFMSAVKNSANDKDIDATKLYPPAVINLLNTNPTLSNMIIRKGLSAPVGSVEEMRNATSILEQALSLLREQAKTPFKIDEQELIKVMREDEFFAPKVVTVDERFFGLPQGTQVIFIKTPILFRLTLVKTDNKFEILWAEPYTDD